VQKHLSTDLSGRVTYLNIVEEPFSKPVVAADFTCLLGDDVLKLAPAHA
jgi:hypothetical protein